MNPNLFLLFSAVQCAEIPFITKVFTALSRITLNSTTEALGSMLLLTLGSAVTGNKGCLISKAIAFFLS